MKQEIALITGASSGIGLELAREFARQGHSLVITAPVQSELELIADELSAAHGVDVFPIAADLEEARGVEALSNEIEQRGIQIDILVNNAGRGMRGAFIEIPLEEDLSMLRLNAEAMLRLTKRFLPTMVGRGRGRVMNTSSIGGFEPGPLLAVYHATKAFVLSLTEAIATELEGTGVTVTALCPGPTDTDFFPKADMVETRAFQKAKVMAPQEVATIAYEAMMKGDRVVVPGASNKAMVFARRFLPAAGQAKRNEKYYEDVAPKDVQRQPGEIAAEHERETEQAHASVRSEAKNRDISQPDTTIGISSLKALLLDELADLLDAEKQLTRALPKMAAAASREDLRMAFEDHFEETQNHVQRLHHIFEILGETPRDKVCVAMRGLIEEGEETIVFSGPESLRDAKLIGAAQRVEHYEIAAYGTARAFAEILGESAIVLLLQETLNEESDADQRLSDLAETINIRAMASPTDGQF